MNKLCTRCGSQIPFIASVCPNCTRDVAVAGNDAVAAATLITVLVISSVIVGIVELIKHIIHY